MCVDAMYCLLILQFQLFEQRHVIMRAAYLAALSFCRLVDPSL
jgi:hypothetical protein